MRATCRLRNFSEFCHLFLTKILEICQETRKIFAKNSSDVAVFIKQNQKPVWVRFGYWLFTITENTRTIIYLEPDPDKKYFENCVQLPQLQITRVAILKISF